MPVITGAIIAVTAAIAAPAFATIAAAVVTVSVAVGTIGLAVTAVGAITGNKDLLKAGEIMGYVGLAGGVAGGVIGGIGGLQAGTGFFKGMAGAYTGASEALSKGWNRGIGSLSNPATGGQVAGPVSGAAGNIPPTQGTTLASGVQPSPAELAGVALQGGPPVGASAPATPSAIGDYGTEFLKGTGAGIVQTPSVPVTPTALGNSNLGIEMLKGTGSQFVNPSVSALDAAKKAYNGMDDWMKYSVMTSGMQGLSGAAAGWFQGASAEEKIEFERLVNAQREQQVQVLNRNAAYAPTLNFAPRSGPAGILNT